MNLFAYALILGRLRRWQGWLTASTPRSLTIGPEPVILGGMTENVWVRPHLPSLTAAPTADGRPVPCHLVQALVVGATSPAADAYLRTVRLRDPVSGTLVSTTLPVLRLRVLTDMFPGPYGIATVDAGEENLSLALELAGSPFHSHALVVGPVAPDKVETLDAVTHMHGYRLELRTQDYTLFYG